MGPKDFPIGVVDAVDSLGPIKRLAAKVIDLRVGLGDHVGHIDPIANDRRSGVPPGDLGAPQGLEPTGRKRRRSRLQIPLIVSFGAHPPGPILCHRKTIGKA